MVIERALSGMSIGCCDRYSLARQEVDGSSPFSSSAARFPELMRFLRFRLVSPVWPFSPRLLTAAPLTSADDLSFSARSGVSSGALNAPCPR